MSLLTLTCVVKVWTNVIIATYRYQLKHSLHLISTKIITSTDTSNAQQVMRNARENVSYAFTKLADRVLSIPTELRMNNCDFLTTI